MFDIEGLKLTISPVWKTYDRTRLFIEVQEN